MDPDLFQCPYLRMQNAANYDLHLRDRSLHDYLLKGGFLWIDDNWDPDFSYIAESSANPARREHRRPAGRAPMFSILFRSTRSARSRRSAVAGYASGF